MPDASVVICAHTERRWDELRAALDSVRAQTVAPVEIIVVVDHNDALLARARKQLPDGVRVVPNDDAKGLSGARNSGTRAARGDVVAFLDDDATAEPEWLAGLLAAYGHPAVIGAGGRIRPRWLGGQPEWFPPEFHWVVGCTYRGMPEQRAQIRNPIGANMSARRELLLELGGFQTTVGPGVSLTSLRGRPLEMMGNDETELSIRASQRWPHMRWIYAPDAVISHNVPRERVSWRYFRARCRSEGFAKGKTVSLVGTRDGLASERRYVTRVLPTGVAQGLAEAARGRPAGLIRAAAIVAGVTVTTTAYVRARLALARNPEGTTA